MYFFDRDRSEIPNWFYHLEAYEASIEIVNYLLLDDKERQQTRPPAHLARIMPDSVLRGLMHITHDKCAFCEQKTGKLLIHHMRGAREYLWLALDWANLFPICRDCNGHAGYGIVSKKTRSIPKPSQEACEDWQFKLARNKPQHNEPAKYLPFSQNIKAKGLETLEPTNNKNINYNFSARFDGHMVGKTSKAKATIDLFSLYRESLVSERRRFIENQFETLRQVLVLEPRNSNREKVLRRCFDFNSLEFASYNYLMLRRLGLKLQEVSGLSGRLTVSGLEGFFRKVIITERKFDQCIESLRREDSAEVSRTAETFTETVFEPLPKHFPSYPRLKSVTAKNFKSLESISMELPETRNANNPSYKSKDIAPCLLILGENATGKSSILEGICYAALDETALGLLDVKPARIVMDPRYMGSDGVIGDNTSRVDLEFHRQKNGVEEAYQFGIELDKIKGTHNQTATGPHPLLFAYGAHRLFGDKQKERSSISNVQTLFKNNVCTINPEDWLIDLHHKDESDFDNVIAAIREVIQVDGRFSTISVVPQGAAPKDQYCEINLRRTKEVSENGKTVLHNDVIPMRFDVVSSGYRVVLALICDIFAGIMTSTGCTAREVSDYNAIVMIDEIEAHLHPRWKLEIISGLRAALPNVTFIFTSHDPLCIRGMYPGEVMVLNRFSNRDGQFDGSQMNEVVEQITEFPNIDTLTVDQLLTSDLFNLYSADSKRMDKYMAHIADIVGRRKQGEALPELKEGERAAMVHFEKEIAEALPIGDSELSRLVQEAVAEFLVQRRESSDPKSAELRKIAKDKIITHLKDFIT